MSEPGGRRQGTVDHVILTRFNLPSGGSEARIRASESWLTNRWTLFERYCAPSVAAQTSSNFVWIIYFDPESPAWLREAIAPYAEAGLFLPIFRAEVPYDDLLGDVRAATGARGDMLVTTNLDNDDGLAIDFIARLQAAVDFSDRRAIFAVHGLIRSGEAVYLRTDPDNAFCSVAEPWQSPRMCWADWHLMLRKSMPVVEISGPPAWLQVIHGENVSNRVRGRLTSPTPWTGLFPSGLNGIVAPAKGRLLEDRLVTSPLRSARDGMRTLARRLAVSILGKDGMQRLKARLGR